MSRSTPSEALAEALADVVRDAVANALSVTADYTDAEVTAMVGVAETARRLNLGETTTKREIAARRLRSVLVGRRRLVPVDAIAEFTESLIGASPQPRQGDAS
jgi:excisionase family DNA binding protein